MRQVGLKFEVDQADIVIVAQICVNKVPNGVPHDLSCSDYILELARTPRNSLCPTCNEQSTHSFAVLCFQYQTCICWSVIFLYQSMISCIVDSAEVRLRFFVLAQYET